MRISQLNLLVVVLVVLCVWLGVMTHVAMTAIGDASPELPQQKSAAATNSQPAHGQRSSVVDALLQTQLKLLKENAESLKLNLDASETKRRQLEAELVACKKKESPERQSTSNIDKPPPLASTRAPDVGLNVEDIKAVQERMKHEREAFYGGETPRQQQRLQTQTHFAPHASIAEEERGISPDLRSHLDHAASKTGEEIIPVLVIGYRRVRELQKCIETILLRMPHHGFQLFVSQDGMDFPEVTHSLEQWAAKGKLVHLIHKQNNSGAKPDEIDNGWEPYYAISHHYRFALTSVFSVSPRYKHLIIIEEDIEVGVDFFDYMRAMASVLDQDSTLYCASAWNDNGKAGLVMDPKAVYRTDFFPGLGWMMTRKLWDEELLRTWPLGFWDDWLRQPKQRKHRACLRPEVPRTFTWCDNSDGVSQGQFCAEHLANIKLADTAINWHSMDLSYLKKEAYDEWLQNLLTSATEVHSADEIDRVHIKSRSAGAAAASQQFNPHAPMQEVKLVYQNSEEFQLLAMQLNLMDDFKDGVPRTAYRGGVVTFRRMTLRIHLVPAKPLY